MARGTLYLPVMIAASVACLVALSAVSQKAEASFPGKNGRIAYVAFGGNDSGIYTIRPDGSGKTRVTNNAREEDDPAYSPDGGRIAYAAWDGNDYEIYTIKAGGGGKTRVTNNEWNDFGPAYSPGGKRIAYSGDDGHDTEIYTINAGGGGKLRVTDNARDEEHPSYSPDGKKIAYRGFKALGSSDDEDYDSEIYTINVGGGGKSQVTDTIHYARSPSWGSRP